MDRIKCCLNPPLHVLTAAPALHSLIISDRKCVARILNFLSPVCTYLRKIILNDCYLRKDANGLLKSIVKLYPDLEVLSLEGCHPITYATYCKIARLENLSELNLSYTKVHYVYVKVLETHVCICESMKVNRPINTFNVFRQEGYLLQFYIMLHNISFSPTKRHLFHAFISFC